MFDSWNSISDNDNMYNVLHLRYSTNITSYGKKFSFNEYNVYYMINSFHDNLAFPLNVWDQDSNVVFDTYIRNDENNVMTIG